MTLKDKFADKRIVFGPFMKLPSPAVVETAALAGFDFVIIDTEHGPLDMLAAENMVRAAKLHQLSPVIRVTENNPAMISRALDIGAEAVQVPQVGSREDAEQAVAAAKFYPLGERGVCRYVRAAGYSSIAKDSYFSNANRDTQVIVHIEGEAAVENFEEILAVEGVDVLFLGPYDLSQSVGVPGEVDHPKVVSRMQQMITKAQNSGKIIGTFVDNQEAARKWAAIGVQYLSYSVDVGIIYQAFKHCADDLARIRG